jgi:hypothetical protein
LAAGRAEPAAQAREPRAGGVERRGRERIADVGRLWRRQRMLWFMARYANRVSEQRELGICFQTILPRQMVLGTGIGNTAAGAYAHALDIEPEAFVARFGAPMPPRVFGENVVAVLDDPAHAEGFAFGLTGDTGVTMIEGLAD